MVQPLASPPPALQAQEHVGLLLAAVIERQREVAEFAEGLSQCYFDIDGKRASQGKPLQLSGLLFEKALEHLNVHEAEFGSAGRDMTFVRFLKGMIRRFARSELECLESPAFVEATVEFCWANYTLLKELGVPNWIIGDSAFNYSPSTAARMLAEIDLEFGRDPELSSIAKTARHVVFSGKYPSAREAAQSYRTILSDAKLVFGADPDTNELVKTAALMVFTRKYKNVHEAKSVYDRTFASVGSSLESPSEALIQRRKAALSIFGKRRVTRS